MDSQTLTIRELAKKTGVSSKALRYWESRRLLPKPGRTHTGYRIYPSSAVKRVEFIRKAQSIGFTLSEIMSLFVSARQKGATCEAVQKWTQRKLESLNTQIETLTALRDEIEHRKRRWKGRRPCPPINADEICCLIEELPYPALKLERR